jgi:bacteriorhodopsin
VQLTLPDSSPDARRAERRLRLLILVRCAVYHAGLHALPWLLRGSVTVLDIAARGVGGGTSPLARAPGAPGPAADRALAAVLGITAETQARVEVAHAVACVAFASSLLLSLLVHFWSWHHVKRCVALRVAEVNYFAFATYVAQFFGGTPTLVLGARRAGARAAQVICPVRFLQWLFTTPALLSLLSPLMGDSPPAAFRSELRASIVADWTMVLFGAAEALCPPDMPRTQAALFAASSVAFAFVVSSARRTFGSVAAALSDRADADAVWKLYRYKRIVWVGFPAARCAALAGALGAGGLEVTYTALDMLAKMVYCVVVMACQFQLVDHTAHLRLCHAEELLTALRNQQDSDDVAVDLQAAFKEAEAWRQDRLRRLSAAGVPTATAASFLDAAVSEYVALAAGRLAGSYGLPRNSRPPDAVI